MRLGSVIALYTKAAILSWLTNSSKEIKLVTEGGATLTLVQFYNGRYVESTELFPDTIPSDWADMLQVMTGQPPEGSAVEGDEDDEDEGDEESGNQKE